MTEKNMDRPLKRARQITLLESFKRSKALKLENSMDDKSKSEMRECLASAAEKRIKEMKTEKSKFEKNDTRNIKESTNHQKEVVEGNFPSSSNQKDCDILGKKKVNNYKSKNTSITDERDLVEQLKSAMKSESTEDIPSTHSSQSEDLFPDEFVPTQNSFKENSPTIPEVSRYDNSHKSISKSSSQNSIDEKFKPRLTLKVSSKEKISELKVSDLKKLPDCSAALPPLTASSNHTILFRPHIRDGVPPRPYPDEYRDKWDEDHVRMPCSPLNRFPVIFPDGQKVVQSRWDLICDSLRQKIESSIDLENAIMQYNNQYSNRWNFSGLHTFFNKSLKVAQRNFFFEEILPGMVHLALQLPQICTRPIPLLKKNVNHMLSLTQKQIGCLLANAFFCTFPRRNGSGKYQRNSEYSSYPDINFNRLFYGSKNGISSRNAEKLKCLLNYFLRITTKEPCGTVTFHRKYTSIFPNWSTSDSTFKKVVICSDGLIETEGSGMLQVDFANSFVGGGVLGHGCVQEEIRFIICPELVVSMLFTEQLSDSEALLVTGVEQYNDYTGYGDTFEWNGDHRDNTPRDAWGRRYTQVVAIDALSFKNSNDQFKLALIKRELNKAFVGFCDKNVPSSNLPAIATGNWGCGAFKGYPNLKFLIQLMAASQAERDIVYFTFGNKILQDTLQNMYRFIIEKKLTVGQLWTLFTDYCNDCMPFQEEYRPSLYDYIYGVHTDRTVLKSIEPLPTKSQTEEIEEYLETTDTE